MKPNQIYSHGIITNHKPFHVEPDDKPSLAALTIIGVAAVVAFYALLIIQFIY